MRPHHQFLTFALLSTCAWLAASTSTSGGDTYVGLESVVVEPDRVHLRGSRSSVQMIVTGTFRNGDVRDLTRVAQFVASDGLKFESGAATPNANGEGEIEVRLAGHPSKKIPYSVTGFDTPTPISFRNETLAALTKQGCNSGSCHGKPNGRGSLELSLNAFDPAADERTLIRAPLLRFTHPLEATESLLLRKPQLQLPHGGGKRLRPTDEAYKILRQWIEEGCRGDTEQAPQCIKVEVFPQSGRVLKIASESPESAVQQVRVVAHFSDGSFRDVTRIASYQITHDRVAHVNAHGLVTGLDRGQTAVVVRYLDDIVTTSLTFVRDIKGFEWNQPPQSNFIDELVDTKLQQLQFVPSGPCDDATFLRRLSLDVRGLLPTVDESREFHADSSANKRSEWIDRFISSPEHARFWSMRMCDLLRINKELLSKEHANLFSQWVLDSLLNDQPYDQFVRELLISHGNTVDSPAANFYRVTADTNTVTETVTQLFMGSRILCAQCHNHPYESWTQDNYYQIGAAFHEVDRKIVKAATEAESSDRKKKRSNPAENARSAKMLVERTPGRSMANPRTGQNQLPWPTNIARSTDEDKREAFAQWLTAKGNPFFARVAVNRLWAPLLGRGIVEPIDDFRSSNPAVNQDLLDRLALEFEESDFDRRYVLRLILNSQTYQRSSEPIAFNESDETLFSHARTRMLTAEQMQDAIGRVCDPTQESELDLKLTQQPFPALTPFLKAFGQPARQTVCACERRDDVSLDQALQLMNSEVVRKYVSFGAQRLSKLPDEAMLSSLYLAAYCRLPTSTEQTQLSKYLSEADNRLAATEDILWSVINTNEFMFQH